jgi:integrase
MARTVRDTKLDSRAARERLSPRHEPYWRTLYEGAHIGYRKGQRGGVWLARYRPAGGRYVKKKLGPADDLADADGVSVLSFKQAQEQAYEWIRQQTADDPDVGPHTVRDAAREYMDWFRAHRRSVRDTQYTIDAFILPTFGDREVDSLKASEIRKWHRDLAQRPARIRTRPGEQQRYKQEDDEDARRRRQASANRCLTVFKALLNHAWKEGRAQSDDAWRRVQPFRSADAARVRYLTDDECRRIVNAADPAFRPVVEAALHTGCRYGELCVLRVGDYEPDSGSVRIRTSKSGKPRDVPLLDEGRAFFERQIAGQPSDAFMFTRANGKPWGKAHQRRPLLDACEHAKITPAVSFHVLRHTYATRLVRAGIPLPVVAAALGHADTRMVDKHYAHLAPSYVADTIRSTASPIGIGQPDNVEPLRAASRQ